LINAFMLGLVFHLWMKWALKQVESHQVPSQVASLLGQVSSQVSSHYKPGCKQIASPKLATRVILESESLTQGPVWAVSG